MPPDDLCKPDEFTKLILDELRAHHDEMIELRKEMHDLAITAEAIRLAVVSHGDRIQRIENQQLSPIPVVYHKDKDEK